MSWVICIHLHFHEYMHKNCYIIYVAMLQLLIYLLFSYTTCRNNGQQNPQGGCRIYWGEYHPLNTQEYLLGDKQTNNRAELSAAIIALTQACQLKMQSVEICTDSRYVKEGITKRINKWKVNKSKTTTDKSDVLNKDLWMLLDRLASKLQVK